MHQGAALVGTQLGPAARFQAQHILQKVPIPAGVVFFQLAGRDAEPTPQQVFQRVQVVDFFRQICRHPAQELQAFRLLFAGRPEGFGQADALGVGQVPAAAQTVQTVGRRCGEVGQFQLRRLRAQRVHDGFQCRAEGQTCAFRPAHPQLFCRGSQSLIEADLFADDAVLKAVGQVDLICHQGVAVGMGQQAALAGRGRELALRQTQHKDIIRVIQTHLACAGKHDSIQRLRNVAEVG